jgi:hypothetical protein
MKAVLAAAMLGVLLLATSAAFAATTATPPAGGTVRVFVTPGAATGKIVLTGAIGDFGKTVNTNKNGKPDPNGAYVKITLQKGGFEVNAVALNKKLDTLKPKFNATTRSTALVASSPVSLFNGTGLYQGISGKIRIKVAFAIVGPRLSNGKCNPSNNAKPLAQFQSITGVGRVRFS